MAEVRPIPSAVGAFEAQVFDFKKTYNAIVQNANAIRRRQIQAQKDIEKQMDVALADRADTRPQDRDYLLDLKQDTLNFYFNNKSDIDSGGKSTAELKRKMGFFTSEAMRSTSLNRRGMSLNPAWKEAMKDENQMDDGLTEVQRVWSLPINDPKRKEATFDRGGYQAGIDEFDVPDISYYKKFNETKDLDDAITRNVKPYSVETMRLTTNPKIGKYVDQNTKITIFDPMGTIGQVESVANSKPRSFLAHYAPQLAVYKALPQEERDLELKGVIDAYKDMTGTDMSSWFAKQGGTAGIDNEFELAAFKKLQTHMPRLVKDTYDYRTQNVMFRQWEQRFRAAKFDWEKMQVKTLDEQIVDDINSGKYVPEVWDERLNAMYNVGNPVTGGTRAGEVKSSVDKQGNVTVNYTIQKPIYGTDGTLLTTSNANLNNVKNQYVNPTTGTDVAVAPNGVYYTKQTRTDVIRKKDPAGIFKVTTYNDRLREGVNNEDVGKSIDAYRFKPSGLKGQPGVTAPKSKGSGQSIKMNKTTNR